MKGEVVRYEADKEELAVLRSKFLTSKRQSETGKTKAPAHDKEEKEMKTERN